MKKIFMLTFCLLLCIYFVSLAQARETSELLSVYLDTAATGDSDTGCTGYPISYVDEEINITWFYCEGEYSLYDETDDEYIYEDVEFGDVNDTGQVIQFFDDMVASHEYTFTVTMTDYNNSHSQSVRIYGKVWISYDPEDLQGMCP